jgi:hypothetical protein
MNFLNDSGSATICTILLFFGLNAQTPLMRGLLQ